MRGLQRLLRRARAAASGEVAGEPAGGRQARRAWGTLVLRVSLVAGLIGVHLLLFPPSRSVPAVDLEVGSITEHEIYAPFTFRAPRPDRELEAARFDAAQRVEPVYRLLPEAEEHNIERLQAFFHRVAEVSAQDSIPLADRIGALRTSFPGIAAEALDYLLEGRRLESVSKATEAVAARLLAKGIVDVTPQGTYQAIRVLAPGEEETSRAVGDVVLSHRLEEEVRRQLSSRLKRPRAVEAGVAVAVYLLTPNLAYDVAQTEERRASAAGAVPADREYLRNERIVDAGVRVTADHVKVLRALEEEKRKRALARDTTITVRLYLGRILLLLLVFGGLGVLLRVGDRSILDQPNRLVLAAVLLVLFLAASSLVLRSPALGLVAVPIPLLAMLATILFRESAGARLSFTGILLLAVVPAYATPLVAVWAMVAAVTVLAVRKVRNRNRFYVAIGILAGVYSVGIVGLTLAGATSAGSVFRQVLLGIGSGAASTALALFLLPLFEATFAITTDLTLLELSDLNHPLLRRMSLESPGTYHHSQIVGTLAEAGARATGSNSLLARVGANFHDIGKMLKPRYYVENQTGENAHDGLSPSMSALVIAAHVRDGVELGRQWGLPREVTDFIPEHHGTSIMQYFYHRALEREDGSPVKVDDFRYPGPKPRCRETAIVMLADGVEASTRSLQRPTPSRIREMVKKIFDRRMAEGQLDSSGLTLSDLARIREAFVSILVGIHHHRVPYPGQREHEEKKEKESLAARARTRRGGAGVATRG